MTSPATEPLVEIVIPTYARPHLLPGAARSALERTPFHVTVLDDHSPDTTGLMVAVDALVREFGPRLRFLRNEVNLGAHLNILRTLEVSRARYTWPFSDDMVVTNDAASHILASIAANPDVPTHFWHPYVDRERELVFTGAESYVSFVEGPRMLYGLSDLHFNRVIETAVGRRYYRVDGKFSQAQPMLAMQLAALSDGLGLVVHGGSLAEPQELGGSGWNEGYLMRFKLDPGYALTDGALRERYRAVVAAHIGWRRNLVDIPHDRAGSTDIAFMRDAASLVIGSDVRLSLRLEAWLARRLSGSRFLQRLYLRLRPPADDGEERVQFSEMKW